MTRYTDPSEFQTGSRAERTERFIAASRAALAWERVWPALYDAHHEIVRINEPGLHTPRRRYDVVGPVCETSDIFAADRDLPELKSGDLVAILSAGAYGAVMASAYNARPPAPEVLVKGDLWSVVRPRPEDDALFGSERIPDWLTG